MQEKMLHFYFQILSQIKLVIVLIIDMNKTNLYSFQNRIDPKKKEKICFFYLISSIRYHQTNKVKMS